MRTSYDCQIVGDDPAACLIATELAQQGFRTLLRCESLASTYDVEHWLIPATHETALAVRRWQLDDVVRTHQQTQLRTLTVAGDPLSQQFAASVDSIRAVESASSSNLVDFLITNSNFARWRELTVTYDVPNRFAQKAGADRASLSLSAHNLALWTNYQGFEPEAMFLGGTRGGNVAWEQTTLPQLRTWIVTLNLTF